MNDLKYRIEVVGMCSNKIPCIVEHDFDTKKPSKEDVAKSISTAVMKLSREDACHSVVVKQGLCKNGMFVGEPVIKKIM